MHEIVHQSVGLEQSEFDPTPSQKCGEPRSLQALNDAVQSASLDRHVLKQCSKTAPQTINLCTDADGKDETYEYVPSEVVTSDTLDQFKHRLDTGHRSHSPLGCITYHVARCSYDFIMPCKPYVF